MRLKKELQLVSDINCYVTGSFDTGLLIITGKLNEGITFEQLDAALWELLEILKGEIIDQKELDKILLKIRTTKEFDDQGILNRAMNLCVHELLGDANGVNEENEKYLSISGEHIYSIANETLKKTNCSLLKVKAKNA